MVYPRVGERSIYTRVVYLRGEREAYIPGWYTSGCVQGVYTRKYTSGCAQWCIPRVVYLRVCTGVYPRV